jgi:hypothetical protein
VFKSFRKTVANSIRNFNFADRDKKKQIFDLASQRHQRGFPPRKPDSSSLGDAINWEWILDSAELLSSDVLIVSRDGDYGLLRQNECYMNDWLSEEFKNRVSPKRKAALTPSLTAALKSLGVKVTAAEEQEEQHIIDQSGPPPRYPPFWGLLLDAIKNENLPLHECLKASHFVSVANNTLSIHYTIEKTQLAYVVDSARKAIEVLLLRAVGQSWRVSVVLHHEPDYRP